MKGLKKTLSMLLVLTLILSLLSACGNGSGEDVSAVSSADALAQSSAEVQEPTATEPESNAEEDAAASASEPETASISYPIADGAVLTSWGSMNANLTNYMESLSDNSVIKRASEITGVTLETTSVSSDSVSDQFALMIAAGDYTDFIDNIASFYGSNASAIEDGVIVDLSGYVQEYAPDYYAELSTNESWLRFATTDEGYMPLFCQLTRNANTLLDSGYLIRQDWLDELNLDVPTTTDELHDVLVAFQTEKNASAPMWYNSNGLGLIAEAYGACALYEPMGGFYPFYVIDDTVYCGYQSEDFKAYLKNAAQWYEEGLIWKDFVSDTFCFGISTSNALSLFTNDNMGVAYGEMTDISAIPSQANGNMVLTAMPDPTVDGSVNHLTSVDAGIGYKHGISTNCEDIELACKYINFFYTEEGYDLCTYGVENEGFVYDDNGNKQYTELITDNPDGLGYDNAFDIYCLMDFSCIVNGARKLQIYDEDSLAASEVWAASRDGAYIYPKGAALTAEESSEFNGIFTDLNTYVNESVLSFITGGKDVDEEWDAFQEQIVNLGAEDALQLKVDAYNRYISR